MSSWPRIKSAREAALARDAHQIRRTRVLVIYCHPVAESFAASAHRTVLEALAIGRSVVGWDHGGVGELLGRYYPEGRVALGDEAALLAATLRALEAPTPAPIHPQTLQQMQAQTLELYGAVAG